MPFLKIRKDGVLDKSSPQPGSLHILIVDDEANIRRTLSMYLESEGHSVAAVSNFQDAVDITARKVFDAAFVDVRLGTENGLDLIPVLKAQAPSLKIIVITAYASIKTAVEAMQRGASDYIPKPFEPEQVLLVIERIAELRSMETRIATLQSDLQSANPEFEFVSSHADTQRAIDLARQAAPSEAIILLRGESGTGKSILAKQIHGWSKRSGKPMGIVSCPSLSPELLESELFGHVKGAFTGAVRDTQGRIEACSGGTLFLDEIGELPLSIQSKLLRFVQEREYERVGDHRTRKADVRIIVATNSNLEQAVKDGTFREDLFFRLNVIQILLPPLRERPEDIQRFAEKLLTHFGAQNHKAFLGFTDETMRILREYIWPGNMRELRNAVERAAILCNADYIPPEFLPDTIVHRGGMIQLGDHVSLDRIEEMHIRRVLASTRSLQDAALTLGIDQATLWRKRRQYGI